MNTTYSLGSLRLERALVALDTETTGVDLTIDRIVELAMVRLHPSGSAEEYRSLVNPEMPIPVEASRVHGITDEQVAKAPPFREIAPEVLEFLAGADLTGYNLLRFDIPLLKNEFRRAVLDWNMAGMRIVDAQAIFHRKEPRDLTAAYHFYCGRDLEGAHGALADARATLEVLISQVDHYPELPRDISGLDREYNQPDPRYVDSERKFFWRNDEPCFAFGNYRGEPLQVVAQKDPQYLDWILRKDFSAEVKDLVRKARDGVIPKRPQGRISDLLNGPESGDR